MGDTKAESPTLATTLRRGRRVHAGPDWKQMGPPCQVPDTPGVGGAAGEKREKEGQPHAGSQSRPALRPRAGLKTPAETQGRRRPSGSSELGEVVKEGQGP